MKITTICGCLLAAATLLLLAACAKESPEAEKNRLKKGPEREAAVVNIDGCRADPDWARVRNGGNVSWSVPTTDTNTYTIQFKKTPLPESTVKVSAKASDKPHPVKGDFFCTTGLGSCLYAYTLTKEDGTECPDPGVHVIP
jgi:hypothetical protein